MSNIHIKRRNKLSAEKTSNLAQIAWNIKEKNKVENINNNQENYEDLDSLEINGIDVSYKESEESVNDL
ncbi:121_t:CDS:2 [Entrophospora sp. SA101]|nr:5710_t:CDS:2 [Entrophospora sp. SA101]CAJ0626918.1 121_t:CDS:2 [Entrophospora sp. SA101]